MKDIITLERESYTIEYLSAQLNAEYVGESDSFGSVFQLQENPSVVIAFKQISENIVMTFLEVSL